MANRKRTDRKGLDGPPICCGTLSLYNVQGMVGRTVEIPPNDPPTYFAAGAWRCAIDPTHYGSWVHRTTDPDRYLEVELRQRLGLIVHVRREEDGD